jgi:hypothetical protein
MAEAAIIGVATILRGSYYRGGHYLAEDPLLGRLRARERLDGPDGAGLDGVRGGAPRTIRTMRPSVVVEQRPQTYVQPEQPQESYWYIARIQRLLPICPELSRRVDEGGAAAGSGQIVKEVRRMNWTRI